MSVAAECNVSPLQLALALHVDLLGSVDQDVGDGRVAEQRLQRPQSKYLVLDGLHDLCPRFGAQRGGLLFENFVGRIADLLSGLIWRNAGDQRQIETIQQLGVGLILDRPLGHAQRCAGALGRFHGFLLRGPRRLGVGLFYHCYHVFFTLSSA